MSEILTLDAEANRRCMTEINGVLKKYGRILSPKVIMTMAGMQFSIEVVAAQLSAPTPGNLGKVGTPDA